VRDSKIDELMSALGQKQTSDERPLMSALPPKADIKPRFARSIIWQLGNVRRNPLRLVHVDVNKPTVVRPVCA
jgi:hypothetical protein